MFGRWARQAGLLVTPEERNPPPILTASVAHARRLRGPANATLELGRNEQARDAYIALIPPQPAKPVDKRLPEVSAAAKIDVASTQAQALNFLDRAERAALLNTPALLDRWARLPQ